MNGYSKNNPNNLNVLVGSALQLFFLLLLACNSHAQVTITYTYDELDRLQTVSRSDGPQASFVTDAVGNIASDNITNSPDTDGDLLANFADLDDDNDGMPDAWELLYSLNALDANDATLDPDGDGRNNLQEFNDETNPLVNDAVEGVNVPIMPWLGLGVLAGLLVFIRKVSRNVRLVAVPLLMGGTLAVMSVSDVQAQEATLVVPQVTVPITLQALSQTPVNPGWHQGVASPVSSEQARQILGVPELGVATVAAPASMAEAPITQSNAAFATPSDYSQLAEALENDPVRIYQYVRNHVEYVPYYGALKGAYLTLFERSGNDFDQAALLIEILRAAGYTANFRYGLATVDTSNPQQLSDLADWLGTDEDKQIIADTFSNGGVPVTQFTNSVEFDRVWVEVTLNSAIVSLDPAYKLSTASTVIDLDAAMGFNEASLLSVVGGTLGADSIENMSESGLASYLSTLTTQLNTYLKQNHPNDTVEQVVGGYTIIPDQSNALPGSLPLSVVPTQAAWATIPSNYVHTVQLIHGGINTTQDIPDIAGRKLSINYVGGGGTIDPPVPGATDFGTVAVGALGATLTLQPSNTNSVVIQVTSTLTGSGASAFNFTTGGGTQNIPANGGTVDVGIQLTGLGQTSGRKNAVLNLDFTYNGSSIGSQTVDITGVVDADTVAEIYLDDVLLVSEGSPSGNLNDLVVAVDHPYAGNGGTLFDQTVTFNVDRSGAYVLTSAFGGDQHSTLLAERQRRLERMSLDGTAIDSREMISETLNIIGQSWMQQTQLNEDLLAVMAGVRNINHHRFGIAGDADGYYVDIKSQFVSSPERTATAKEGGFQSGSLISSAMEHSVLEQLQGAANPGISTIKIFALNNQSSDKLFLANSANYASIQTQLTNYSSNDLSQFQASTNAGHTIILPENGAVSLNDWSGKGYIDYYVNGAARSLGMIIGGDFNGGFSSLDLPLSPTTTRNQSFLPSLPPQNISTPTAADPVDLGSGAFLSHMTDIALGGSGARGLGFSRSYNSQQVSQNVAAMGRGWNHNYNIYVAEHSDTRSALGERTVFDASSVIVATHVIRSLMEPTQPSLQQWAVASLTANWNTDQLLNKAVTVHVGDRAMTYRELPNGSYTPPAGVTTELVKLGDNTYELRERFGTVLKFNSDNRVQSLTDIDGNALVFSYTNELLTLVQDTFGRSLTLAYTGSELTSITDSTSRSVSYSYTGEDLTGVTGLESANWQYSYDSLHRMLTVINPVTTTIVDNTYDDFDRVIEQEAPRQTGTATYKMHYTGFSSSDELPDGSRMTYHFDVDGRTVAVEDAQGNTNTTQYDGQGHASSVTDALGNITTSVFDANNNLIEIQDASIGSVDLDYDVQHRLIRSTNALNHSSETDFDAEHHPTNSRDALNNEVITAYRADGLVNAVTNARNVITTPTYDSFGQTDTQQTGSQPATDSDYNNRGWLTSLTDQAGAQTQFAHDDRGLITTRTDALSETTTNIYNGLGLLTNQTDRNGETATISYTPTSKVDTLTYPSRTAASGNVSGFSVDFTYDNKDRLTTMVDQHGSTTNGFDALDRLTSHTDPNGHAVQYDYDAAGNVTQLTYPDGKTVSYSYDSLNRISDVSIDWLNKNATPNYDAAGRLTGITHFNDTSTTYQFDNANRLTGLTHYRSNNQTLADYQYILDANGNRIQATITNEPILPAAMINAVHSKTFNTQKNRLLSAVTSESLSFIYDDEGQTETVTGTATNTVYGFDAAHRLVNYNTASQVSNFVYDGAGNRLLATRQGVTTQYIHDAGGNLIAEANSSGTITRFYIYGLGLMAMVDAQTSELYVYHFDGTGHTVAMTNGSEQITHRYAYAAFGKIQAKEETVSQPFTYAGQVGIYTEADNVYYMRARYYDAEIGRFISEDPAGFGGGINLYAYVGGNPIGAVDPNGLCPWCIGGAANLAIDAAISLATTGTYSWQQAGIAAVAGATGGALAQRFSQVARLAGTVRQVSANALAGGTINVAAGAANGSDSHLTNFALGAGGSALGSGVGALTTASNNTLFGLRGAATGTGKVLAAGFEALAAGGSGLFSGSGK